jgi:hypothetical protein
MSRDEQGWSGGSNFKNLSHEGQAVHVRHSDIADNDVVIDLAYSFQCRHDRFGRLQFKVANVQTECFGQGRQQTSIIIDNKDSRQ